MAKGEGFGGHVDTETRKLHFILDWRLLPVGSALAVVAVYLLTHDFPGNQGGLFFVASEQIQRTGYALPDRIPYYTRDGIPFAYPPLMFYVLALTADVTGRSLPALGLYLPAVLTIAYVYPTYLLGMSLFDDRRISATAAFVVSVSPAVFAWHLSVGGFVRAAAFLFCISGAYVGIRLFRTHAYRYVAAGTAFFTLTALTHPEYTLFYVLNYCVFYAYYDRSRTGLVQGTVVGGSSLLLTSPWWLQVVSTYGIDIYTQTAGSRGGIFPGPARLAYYFLYDLRTSFLPIWHVLGLVGVGYLVAKREYLVPAWFGAVAVAIPRPRFLMLVAAFACAVVLWEVVGPAVRDVSPSLKGVTTAVIVFSILGFGLGAGGIYAAGYETPLTGKIGETSMDVVLSSDDRRAMEWIAANTREDATFLVAGAEAEWFPYFTERTLLNSPWGAAWLGTTQQAWHSDLYSDVSACHSLLCFESVVEEYSVSPTHLYVPTTDLTETDVEALKQQVRQSSHELAFGSDEVVVISWEP